MFLDRAERGPQYGANKTRTQAMPESPRMVPLYIARIVDLRAGQSVSIRCRACRHVAELAAIHLRERLPRDAFVKHLGPQFRCQLCGHKGAEVGHGPGRAAISRCPYGLLSSAPP